MGNGLTTQCVDVPDLIDLYNIQLVQNVEKMFLENKDKYYEVYPSLKKFDENMLPIYFTYFAICNFASENETTDISAYITAISEYSILDYSIDNIIYEFDFLIKESNLAEENYRLEYDAYVKDRLISYEKDPKVLRFMQIMKDDRVKNIIKGYLISTGGVNIEKFGLDYSTDDTINFAYYEYYKFLYEYCLQLCGFNIVRRIIFMIKFKNVDYESLNELVNAFLKDFDEGVMTFDEYCKYFNNRKKFIIEIIAFADSQYLMFKGESRVREE